MKIDVFEPGNVGGRLATENIAGGEYETGGAIIHPLNLHMKHFVDKLGKHGHALCQEGIECQNSLVCCNNNNCTHLFTQLYAFVYTHLYALVYTQGYSMKVVNWQTWVN